MRERKVFRYLWVISLFVVAALSCNLVTNVKDAVEMKDTIAPIITDVGGMITDMPLGSIETQVGSIATEFEGSGSMETMQAQITDLPIPGLTGDKPADIPVMEGASEIVGSADLVTYFIDKGYQEVVDYYKREMPNNGWTKTDESVDSDYAELIFEKGGRKATVEISGIPFIEQTSVTINIEGG
jgi:hypothetical protein